MPPCTLKKRLLRGLGKFISKKIIRVLVGRRGCLPTRDLHFLTLRFHKCVPQGPTWTVEQAPANLDWGIHTDLLLGARANHSGLRARCFKEYRRGCSWAFLSFEDQSFGLLHIPSIYNTKTTIEIHGAGQAPSSWLPGLPKALASAAGNQRCGGPLPK